MAAKRKIKIAWPKLINQKIHENLICGYLECRKQCCFTYDAKKKVNPLFKEICPEKKYDINHSVEGFFYLN